ncbi:pitrilysin family protein [Enterobacteriaceae bacterium ESL0689]|nr:pitrilysin family protein [Enterobacteriaceae bacterium ESL0689]
MQVAKMRRLTGGVLMLVIASYVSAEPLQPDPAWKQGTLTNGFRWQVLATPQRPGDRIEVRLLINTGSLSENSQQNGFSRFIPRLALTQNSPLSAIQGRLLWQQNSDTPSPAVVSYSNTMFSFSLTNDRSDLLKETLNWLSMTAGSLTISADTVNHALQGEDKVATWPTDTREGWWHYRLKGSAMLVHDPAVSPKMPIDIAGLTAYYQQWYTPDVMTLIVVGNIDSRSVTEQINKTFGELKGKRETPATLPILSPLPPTPVNIMTHAVEKDKLSIMWDTAWQPIQQSIALQRYWRDELAREALFWRVQQSLVKKNIKDVNPGFDCRVLYQRAQCAIHIESPGNKLNTSLTVIANELVQMRDNGLLQEEFDALIARKNMELQKLFATYGRTNTEVLMSQRLRSLQNQVVDIAPEQYQTLRQQFLNSLTVDMLNQYLHQQLSQEMALVLQQPYGEEEYNMKDLKEMWEALMAPPSATAPLHHDPADNQNDVADIAPTQP